MKKIDTTQIKDWSFASKTRPIKAKPLINLLVDRTITNKFLVDTLEGREPLGDGVVICVAEAGDTWQQMPKKLLQKYHVSDIDNDGWLVCEPIPDNSVNCIEISATMARIEGIRGINRDVYITGHFGETIGNEKNVYRGVVGDFICRNQFDHSDVWIVRRSLFLNTYTFKS